MKQVYVLRHAPKDETGNLTKEGKELAVKLQSNMPEFHIIIASDSLRTQETAILLTQKNPIVDTRAGFYNSPKEISEKINIQAKTNPAGFTGAYLENQSIRNEVNNKAKELINLIFETLEKLQPDEKALIISHDITMVPAAKLLTSKFNTKTFQYLSGYIIDENKEFTPYAIK